MATTDPSAVKAFLTFNTPPPKGERAFVNINADSSTAEKQTNAPREPKEVTVENVRGKEDTVSLNSTGFQYFKAPAKYKTFTNDEEIQKEYYPESAELIKKLTGASKVVLFDHTVRRRRPGEADDGPSRRQPVGFVHVDQTTQAAIARVHRHLPADEAPKLLEKRFQLINLWRPILHAAFDQPLALCDYRSVEPEKDTFPLALVYPDREGEIMGVNYSEKMKWRYLRGMTPDEIVLIKCFDSLQDGKTAVFTPHTGFKDPSTPVDAPLRESIEVRALVFYD
ncbi:hypothetical protein CPB83DRAFT_855172 [Crepidotus variabilis]|uniref:Methyltransferase n=1 Tax=Crepidotus variabilis TaxID=179855 RepID=A0A9P6JPS8_9AGAR|nr:hypothetical protein CPB83DRAFT_855172 [Crepidotus variabilis]